MKSDYNGSNIFVYVNATKRYQFKAKDSEIKSYLLCLRNISKYFTIGNLKKTGLKGYVDDISVDYNIIEKTKIINIHECLIKKTI